MRALTIAMLMLLTAGPVAAAPNAPGDAGAAASGTAARTVAPTGHRQPTERSLPPAVRKRENTTGRGVPHPFGPLPKICTDC